MQEGQKDLSELATTATDYASSLLEHGKSWLNALTIPMASCMNLMPDLEDEQLAECKRQEKATINKLA
ncbi:MAG TPA: hypothetical protein PLD88_13725, partial [Candidatus Berkiella sp.]|nr:hypothetical protein [Candidatus Berkiella sp.]